MPVLARRLHDDSILLHSALAPYSSFAFLSPRDWGSSLGHLLNLEMATVACPIENWHHLVITESQLSSFHNVASRRIGNLIRLLSPK